MRFLIGRLPLSTWCRVAFVFAVMALVPGPPFAFAQSSPTGALAGTVADSDGGVMPGVTVNAKHAETGFAQSTVTGPQGDWRLASLPLGTYEISFELTGFKKLVRNGVTVDAGVTRPLNTTLEVGALSEAITVSADVTLISTTTATTFRSLTTAELQAVPTSTGSFTHLLSSEAGVSSDLRPYSSTVPATSRPR